MPPRGNLVTAGPAGGGGGAPNPPGVTLASKAGSGVTDDTASAQLGGTDRVPSDAAWPTLADAASPRPGSGPTPPRPLTAPKPEPASAPEIEPRPAKSR